ncbi:L,D-transpeptidase family protein [Phycicoccus flavus]|uniref:L,D-transpeptidase family protein n=1 Tax=Phycicoccus flavus TaxID=2502783 RepID=UPI000FEB8606|nr:L,D-transpeptidase family protein [Phycicoccus flavus]NHA67192.1 L,D-transpeptidase family protein [Phycicoccus flavus]
MISRTKVMLAAAVAVPMALGGVGTAYATHYQDRALPGSSLAGTSVAGMTRAEVADAVREAAADVEITVTAGRATEKANLADLGWSVDVDATVDRVFAANSRWSNYATSLVSERDVDAVVTVDPARTEAVSRELVQSADKVGRDAEVRRAKDGESFVVRPAVVGQRVVASSFEEPVTAAAEHLRSTAVTVRFADTAPKVTTAAAKKVAKRANAMIDAGFAVSDGAQQHSPSRAERASWVSVPTTAAGGPGRPVLDTAKVASWVEGVAAGAQSEPVTGSRYVDSEGEVRLVLTEAVDGRTVSNGASLGKQAGGALARGKEFSADLAYDVVPATWDEKQIARGAEKLAYPAAEGEKWVDVNLTKHTMTAYLGAKAVKGPVKMVDGSSDFPTTTGLFHVYLKNPMMTMRGTNADGTKYETPDVQWSSFFVGGIALHAAPWRESFGYSGSHGCINLPVPVAKWVYDWAPVGTPVSSHY